VIALFLISVFGFKYYRLTKKKSYLTLALSFVMMGIAFLFKVMTNFTLYYKVEATRQIGFVTLTYHTIKSSNTMFFMGWLFFRLLTLLGLYVLYSIYVKRQTHSNLILIVYLIIISTYFSQSRYFIFHLTSLLLLGFICYQYKLLYKRNKSKASLSLLVSFVIIALSQILFIFIFLSKTFNTLMWRNLRPALIAVRRG